MRKDSHFLEAGPEMVAKTPKRSRGHNRVAALLDAAAAIFARDGYDAATMTEIAAQAGASIGSLYQFFPTKALVAEALYGREMEALTAALALAADEALINHCGLDTIADRLFVALLDFIIAHPALPIVSDRRDAEAVRLSKNQPGMREQIAELLGRASPPPAPEQARHVAALVLVLMKGAVAVRVYDDPDSRRLIDGVRAMLRGHLTTTVG